MFIIPLEGTHSGSSGYVALLKTRPPLMQPEYLFNFYLGKRAKRLCREPLAVKAPGPSVNPMILDE